MYYSIRRFCNIYPGPTYIPANTIFCIHSVFVAKNSRRCSDVKKLLKMADIQTFCGPYFFRDSFLRVQGEFSKSDEDCIPNF